MLQSLFLLVITVPRETRIGLIGDSKLGRRALDHDRTVRQFQKFRLPRPVRAETIRTRVDGTATQSKPMFEQEPAVSTTPNWRTCVVMIGRLVVA